MHLSRPRRFSFWPLLGALTLPLVTLTCGRGTHEVLSSGPTAAAGASGSNGPGGGGAGGGTITRSGGAGGGTGASSAGAGGGGGAAAGATCQRYAAPADQTWCETNSASGTPTLAVRVSNDQAPTVNQPIVVAASGGVTVHLNAITNAAFQPASFTWAAVTDVINHLASTTPPVLSSPKTTGNTIDVTFSAPGIYEFQVSATDGTNSASRYVWVNVWDSVPATGPNNIGRNPGIDPPTSVQMLSADPGPLHHPRILFSRGDWPALHAKALPGTLAPDALASANALATALGGGFDKPGDALNNLVQALQSYAAVGYPASSASSISEANGYAAGVDGGTATIPGIYVDDLLGNYPASGGQFTSALLAASLLAWLAVDPTLAHDTTSAQGMRLQSLATLTAAWAHYASTIGLSSPSLALAYDLTFDWMTEAQQTTTRDYLYTIGNLYNTGGGGVGIVKPKDNPNAFHQNGGDFPNGADGIIFPALAIEGEETLVTPAVLNNATYGTYLAAAADTTDPNVVPSASWPFANDCSVRNLGRQVRLHSEWYPSTWGFDQNMFAYYEAFISSSGPTIYALARRGENEWVTTNLYQGHLHALYNIARSQKSTLMQVLDHHDGSGWSGGQGERNSLFVAKYMYPDDPMVDYIVGVGGTDDWNGDLIARVIFGAPPLGTTMSQMAAAKHLGLNKLDPAIGFAIVRNGWDEDDFAFIFNNYTLGGGHYHAEANSFSLFALGRVWSTPPGYHVTVGDAQSEILVQLPQHAADPSDGYIGQGPSSYSEQHTPPALGDPFHGALLDFNADPGGLYTWIAGDAKPAYDFVSGSTTPPTPTNLLKKDLIFPGLLGAILPELATEIETDTSYANAIPYNPVAYAFRSALVVRGTHPYALIIDDFSKDTATYNYRWSMNDSIGFGPSLQIFLDAKGNDTYSSLEIESGATPTQAVLYHDLDVGTANGLPRLLVRDLTEQSASSQPAISIVDLPIGGPNGSLNYGVDNNLHTVGNFPSRRLEIERDNVVAPNYKILLYPFSTGDAMPVTSWDSTNTVLTIEDDGHKDTINLDKSNADHRTRLASFARQ